MDVVKESIKLLKRIGDYPLVTGFENYFVDELLKITKEYTGIGERIGLNIVGINKTNVFFVSHYDEIGFVVDNQYKLNLYRTIPMGLISWERGYGKVFQTRFNGEIIRGVGSSPLPHGEASEKRLFIELEKEVDLPGLYPFTWENRVIETEDRVFSKALDNRIGVVTLLQLAKRHGFSFILTHGEEQGTTRLKETLEFIEKRVENPLYIIVDSFPSKEDEHYKGDYEGLEEPLIGYIPVEGGGLGNIAPKELVDIFKDKLKEVKTFNRAEVTDATTFYRMGKKAIAVGYPLRYLHSPLECINKEVIVNLYEKLKEM